MGGGGGHTPQGCKQRPLCKTKSRSYLRTIRGINDGFFQKGDGRKQERNTPTKCLLVGYVHQSALHSCDRVGHVEFRRTRKRQHEAGKQKHSQRGELQHTHTSSFAFRFCCLEHELSRTKTLMPTLSMPWGGGAEVPDRKDKKTENIRQKTRNYDTSGCNCMTVVTLFCYFRETTMERPFRKRQGPAVPRNRKQAQLIAGATG